MKNLLFSLFLIIISPLGVSGQVKYQAEISIGLSVESLLHNNQNNQETNRSSRVIFHHISSARINDYFSLGLGMGVDIDNKYVFDGVEHLMPIYLNAKGYLPMNANYLFLEFSGGHSFGMSKGSKGMGGILLGPGVGFVGEVGSGVSMFLSLNLHHQRWSEQIVPQRSAGIFLLKAGVMF